MNIKERLRRFFTENLSLKLLAVALAFVFWITFITIEDPVSTDTYRINVQVNHLQEYLGNDNYIELKNGNDISKLTLSVTVRARLTILKELNEKDISTIITAVVDVYDEQDGILKIRYEIDKAYEDKIEIPSLLNTSYLEVITEGKASKSIPLHQTISGQLAEGYVFFENQADITPEYIDITGPESKVAEFAYGQINLVLDGEKENVYRKLEISFYKEDGSKIEFSRDIISTSVSVASINVPVYLVKEVPLKVQLTGTPPGNYGYRNDAALSLETIEIYGKEDVLDTITEILLPEISLENIRGSYTATFQLPALLEETFGDAVRLFGDETETVLTLSTEEKEQRSVKLSLNDLVLSGLPEDWEKRWTIKPVEMDVEVLLTGLPEQLDEAVRNAQISVVLDEAKLQEGISGTYPLVLSNLGEAVKVQEAPGIHLEITAK